MNTVQKIFRFVLFVLFLFHSFEIKRGHERFSATKTQLEINQHEDSGKDCAHKIYNSNIIAFCVAPLTEMFYL